MKQFLRNAFALTAMLLMSLCAKAGITEAGGWFEAAYAQWEPVAGAKDYHVYVRPTGEAAYTPLDRELVRQYPGYYRADAVGLKAGSYVFKIVPVDASGNEMGS